ncbi:hypothetical protein FTV88_3256 [Heliorestis convoluta]|uniref:Uncharacterized protein n=1 Tax=Heliorestis convoluta TaxID=356322 RepID=A0A5Q2N7D3_9FIRM|nr:hypothetical protein FTV88_3256 [Heliorestis convoluta]
MTCSTERIAPFYVDRRVIALALTLIVIATFYPTLFVSYH